MTRRRSVHRRPSRPPLAAAAASALLLAAPLAPAQPPGEAMPGAAAGDGPVRERREDGQLRELDALSRQLAPGVPLPAPGLDPAQRR